MPALNPERPADPQPDRDIQRYVESWESNANEDALFAILTDDQRRGSWTLATFFDSGRKEIDLVFAYLAKQGIASLAHRRFLDFGCGVGRLTQALGKKFDSGIGVDISSRMIELARQYAAAQPNLEFVLNQKTDLAQIPSGSVDFVYCHIVLQHMPRPHQASVIREFVRVLAPGGIAAFQIPTRRTAIDARTFLSGLIPPATKSAIRKLLGVRVRLEMHVMPEALVQSLCTTAGAELLLAPYSNSTDTDHNGRLLFFDRAEALRRITSRESDSPFLSQFFIVSKAA